MLSNVTYLFDENKSETDVQMQSGKQGHEATRDTRFTVICVTRFSIAHVRRL